MAAKIISGARGRRGCPCPKLGWCFGSLRSWFQQPCSADRSDMTSLLKRTSPLSWSFRGANRRVSCFSGHRTSRPHLRPSELKVQRANAPGTLWGGRRRAPARRRATLAVAECARPRLTALARSALSGALAFTVPVSVGLGHQYRGRDNQQNHAQPPPKYPFRDTMRAAARHNDPRDRAD